MNEYKPMTTTPCCQESVLIVDDNPDNISLLVSALKDLYLTKVATSGRQALEICRCSAIDIILLDIMMPDMDGYETCRRLKTDPVTRHIPVIFVTALHDSKDESAGFACGAVDFIVKPIRVPIVQARVRTHLALYNQNRTLEQLVHERTRELSETRLAALLSLAHAGEYRDNETGLHVSRVCHLSRIIAGGYGLPENEAELLFHTVGLHDTGKIGIPDRILLKPGKLDEAEWVIMKTHAEIGYKIIGTHDNLLLATAATIALTHHERWDGSGYPRGLKGEEIPLGGRIVAVVDVFDALTSERPYKKAWPIDQALEEIKACRGSHFDPQVVDAFLAVVDELSGVIVRFSDPAV